jgi:hypothetical protein
LRSTLTLKKILLIKKGLFWMYQCNRSCFHIMEVMELEDLTAEQF